MDQDSISHFKNLLMKLRDEKRALEHASLEQQTERMKKRLIMLAKQIATIEEQLAKKD
jgi:hypothetical protein